MNELSILIENIRVALNAPELVPMDAMQRYASLYTEMCTDLNTRIQRCLPYIRNGNFMEAVRLAEIKPPISEVFTILDFEERDAWIEVGQLFDFPPPPPLLYKMMQELNASYTKHSSLDSLLRQHRLLALNDSPLAERVAVLRAIAHADKDNMFWAEDVEKYEKARIAELDNEVKAALAQNNVIDLNALQTELTSPDWTLKPPAHIVRSILSATLTRYATELVAANNEFDLECGRSAYDAMQELLFSTGLSMNAQMQTQIAPAVSWLNEENVKMEKEAVYQQCLHAMQEALDSQESKPYLESCYYTLNRAATQSGNNIPPDMVQHFQELITAHDLSRSRRMVITLAGTLCATVLIAAVVVFVIRNQLHERTVVAQETQLLQLANDLRFDEMQGAIDHVDAKIASHPAIVAGIGQLQTLLAQDKKREADFEQYLEKAKTDLENGNLDMSALSQAEKSIRTQAEKTQYLGLKTQFDTKIAAEKAKINEQFNHALAAIRDDFRAELNDASRPPNEILTQLYTLLRRTGALATTDVQQAYISQRNTLAADIKTAHDGLEKSIKQTEALLAFQRDIGDWTRYKNTLSTFLSAHGDYQDARYFKTVLDELDAINDAASKIKVLTESYNRDAQDVASFQRNASSYAVQLKTLEGILADPQTAVPLLFPAQPLVDAFAKTVPFDPNTAFRETKPIVKRLMEKQVYPMILRGGKWMYFSKDPWAMTEQGSLPSQVPFITSFSSRETQQRISDDDRKPEKRLMGSQYEFALETQKALDGLSTDAGKFSLQTINNILNTSGIDPILKIFLLDAILKDTVKFDPFYAFHAQSPLTIIKDCGVDEYANWMDVSADAIVAQRTLAETTLRERLANLPAIALKCEDLRNKFPESLRQKQSNFGWIGILSRDKDGKMTVMRSNSAPIATGDLYILKLDAAQKIRLIPIGTVSSLTNAANTTGTPVFAKN